MEFWPCSLERNPGRVYKDAFFFGFSRLEIAVHACNLMGGIPGEGAGKDQAGEREQKPCTKPD